MLQITKQGNSIVVEGLNHYFYPYNGTLEVPCNSVITVVDEGDIVLFRSASNYDVLFSANIDEITINGQSVTKDNVGEVFGALSNVSSGGGGLTPEQEEKLNNAVQISDYNADKASQTTIDEAQNTEINKVKGDIEGKQDIIQDLNAIREGANLGKTALQEETDPVWTAEKGNYYTKSEVNTSLESKANKTEIPTVPTNVSAFTNDAGYLTEHQSLDDYYTKTESDGKYATQVVVNEEIAARINDVREVKATLESKADKSEIPSLNGYATEQWVGQQGYLTEHQPLKTINGETIVGNGNIEISSGEETDPVWTAEKVNYYTKTEVNSSLETKANKSEIPTVPTNVSAFTNDAGYLTEHQSLDNYYTKTEVNSSLESKADKTEIPSLNGYATEQWVGDKGYITEETDPTVPSHVKAITEEDIAKWNRGGRDVYKWSFYPYSYATEKVSFTFTKNGDTITGSQGYILKYKRHSKTGEIDGTYQTASTNSFLFNIPLTDDTIFIIAYLEKDSSTFLEFSFDVVSNIKGGGITEETDPIWNAEKGNYYTKTEVNSSLESKADKTEIPTVPTNVSAFTNDAGYLTEHQTLKTINGQTIVGDGNIEITSGEETDPVWTAEKGNYYTKSEIDGIVGNVNNALGEIING